MGLIPKTALNKEDMGYYIFKYSMNVQQQTSVASMRAEKRWIIALPRWYVPFDILLTLSLDTPSFAHKEADPIQ